MRISSAIVVASAPPFHLATTLAEVIYPTPLVVCLLTRTASRLRANVGAVWRAYLRKLFTLATWDFPSRSRNRPHYVLE
jgi:hypothetical protein